VARGLFRYISIGCESSEKKSIEIVHREEEGWKRCGN
jgi:hypothetical protein